MRPSDRRTIHAPGRAALALLATSAILVATTTLLTTAAGAAVGRNYAEWTASGAGGAFTGTADPGVAGFPTATFASTNRAVGTATSATLTASTPFGAAFGTSSGRTYASIGTTAGSTAAASTTFTFAAPTPTAGWGFALGDIDAESIRVTATGADGAPVDPSGLGFEGSFNYASGGTDQPTWDAASSTLRGNPCPPAPAPADCDTSGASGWFRPTVALRSLTLEFTVQGGAPAYQLWIAANSVVIAGTIEPAPPAGTNGPAVEVRVSLPGGPAIGSVVTDTGSFELPPVVAGPTYQVTVVPPEGWQVVGPSTFVVDTADGSPAPIGVVVEPSAPTPPAPTSTPTRPATSRVPAPLRFTG